MGESSPSCRGLDGVLNIRNVDLIPRSLFAVHFKVNVRLTERAQYAEILDPFRVTHDVHNLVGLLLKDIQIVAIDFRGELAFYTADCFLHIVFDGLGKTPADTWDVLQFAT